MFRQLICSILLAALSASCHAGTIIKFTSGSSTSAAEFGRSGSVFSTIDSGNALTSGDVDIGLNFTSFLDGALSDINSGASISISGLMAIDPVLQPLPGVLVQSTHGGVFSIFDDADSLLLEGAFGQGELTGVVGSSAGAFRSVTPITYTGGSIFDQYLGPYDGNVSISLTSIRTLPGAIPGLSSNGTTLNPFSASLTGQFDATQVPEPLSLLIFAIIPLIVLWRKPIGVLSYVQLGKLR